MKSFDVGVIGGGPGGYKVAELLGKKGVSVALVEENELGGVCLNQGCIPFKMYLHFANAFNEAQRLQQNEMASVECSCANPKALIDKKNSVIKGLNAGVLSTLKSCSVEVVKGSVTEITRSNDEFVLHIGDMDLFACDKLIMATGSKDFRPFNKQISSGIKVLGSKELLEEETLPDEMVILGGGIIGIEAAEYLNDLNSKVRIIEAADHIGGNLDLDTATALKKILEKRGIEICLNTKVKDISDNRVVLSSRDDEYSISASNVLVALGRKPRVEEKLCDTIGINYTDKGIIINDHCMTNVPGVYACGDVTGVMMLAHVAYTQARIIADNIMGGENTIDYSVIPKVIYGHPEVVSLGVTEEYCKTMNLGYMSRILPMTYSGRYFAEHGKDGALAKMIINEKRELMGFHMIADGASEISLAVELMISNHMKIDEIQNLIYAHPTYGEIIGELAQAF